jgi:hypothetical protein
MEWLGQSRRVGFVDRREAGAALADRLGQFVGREDVVVLALPRGGVPVGYEVARALGAPLDVFVVRKLGLPGHPELAMGAIASGGVRVLNDDVLASIAVSQAAIDSVTRTEQLELERRERAYRDGRPLVPVEGRGRDPRRRRAGDGFDDARGRTGRSTTASSARRRSSAGWRVGNVPGPSWDSGRGGLRVHP